MKQRLEYIDALRGFAVLGVLVTHVFAPLLPRTGHFLNGLISSGARGVQLFFIVSAFTLFLSLENKRGEKSVSRNFFIRRFFRIAPLFLIAVAVYLIVYGTGPRYWLGDAHSISVWNVLATSFFVNGWNPYWINSVLGINWTIAVEMGFYVFVPLLFSRLKNLFDALLLLLAAGTVLVFLNPFLLTHSPIRSLGLWANFIDLWLPNQFPVFVLGIVLYFLVYPEKAAKIVIGRRRVYALMAVLAAMAAGLLIHGQMPAINSFALLFVGVAFGLSQYPLRLLVNRFTTFLGKVSYSFYLVHILVLDATYYLLGINKYVPHHALTYCLVWIVTLVLGTSTSALTYYYIEKPGIIYGNRLIEKLEAGQEMHMLRWLKKLPWRKPVGPIDRDAW